MVALGPDQIRDPSERHLGEGVVAADRVQENQHGHEQIGGVRETNALEIHPDQRNDDAQDRDVFGNPRAARDGLDGKDGEFDEIEREQQNGQAEFHAPEPIPWRGGT